MLDEFREQASTSPFEEEEAFEEVPLSRPASRFLGMTPVQRLVIALLLLLTTCVTGALALLASGKVLLPSIY